MIVAVLKKGAIAAPTLPRRTVDVPSLGGAVVVRGLKLSQRLAMAVGVDAEDRFRMVPAMLAVTVVDAADEPIFTESQWEEFGAAHLGDAMTLFDAARALSGMDEAALKKS